MASSCQPASKCATSTEQGVPCNEARTVRLLLIMKQAATNTKSNFHSHVQQAVNGCQPQVINRIFKYSTLALYF